MSTMLWADAQQGERFDKRIGKVIIGVFSPPVGPALVMMIKKIFATDVDTREYKNAETARCAYRNAIALVRAGGIVRVTCNRNELFLIRNDI